MPVFHQSIKRFKIRREKLSSIDILPKLSKTYERTMYSQVSAYFDNILFKYQFGFRHCYSSECHLLAVIKNGKKV